MEDKPLAVGDVQTEDGIKWYISAVSFKEGRPCYSRIRVGSLAHSFVIERDNKKPKPILPPKDVSHHAPY